MNRRVLLLVASIFLLFILDAQAQTGSSTPPLFRCKEKIPKVELSINSSGETVEGPACAQIVVNALRYIAALGKTTTYSAGPILTSIFPSPFSLVDLKSATKEHREAMEKAQNLEELFQAHEKGIETIATLLLVLQAENRKAAVKVETYLNNLKALINQSDNVLTTGGPSAVLKLVNSREAKKQMEDALAQRDVWKTTDELVDKIRELQTSLGALPAKFPKNMGTVTVDFCIPSNIVHLGWNDWYSKCRESRYKLAEATLARLLAEATPFTSDGDKTAQIAKRLGILEYWKNVVDSLDEDSFTLQTEVTCGVLFNKNKQTAIKLLLADRTSTFDGQTPQPQTKENLLIVECGSRFSISAGVGFSTIRSPEFSIVQSMPTTPGGNSVNQFGKTEDSAVRPYPIGIAHVRLCESSNHQYGMHFSFGIGASVKEQDAGGSSAEFLTGLSVSFLRTIYLTGGLQIGKQAKLAGGFEVGNTVPPDITTPPISNSYKPGFGFAITFTKP